MKTIKIHTSTVVRRFPIGLFWSVFCDCPARMIVALPFWLMKFNIKI
jgi:hypothetical protein